MSDWGDQEPEQPLTRGQKFRDSIARAVIRPGSAATGEQVHRFSEAGSSYDNVGFNKAVERDAESLNDQKNWIDDTIKEIKTIHEIADAWKDREDSGISPFARDPDSFEHQQNVENLRALSSFYRRNPDIKIPSNSEQFRALAKGEEEALFEGRVPSFGYPRVTNKHITLAALLGKRSVDKVLEERKSYSSSDKDIKGDGKVYYDDGTGYHGEFTRNSAAVGKALHKRKTRNLSRMDRLKERVAPYRVGVYEERDSYGGREEGGWWYNTGELVHESRPFMTKRGALNEEKRLEQQYPRKKRNLLSARASDVMQADEDQGVFDPVEYTDNAAEAFGMPSRFIEAPEEEDYDYSHFGQPSRDYRVYVTRGKPAKKYPSIAPTYE